MAIEDWINYDCDSDDYYGRDPERFEIQCKWCRKNIWMTPVGDKWLPMVRGKVHFCEARRKAQIAADIATMPDMALPECQFCQTPMKHRRLTPDPDCGWSMSPRFRLECPECQSTGPLIELGDPDYQHLCKEIPEF